MAKVYLNSLNSLNSRIALVVAGLIFAAVSVVHAYRIFNAFPVVLGYVVVPQSASIVGLVIAGLLAIWMFWSAATTK